MRRLILVPVPIFVLVVLLGALVVAGCGGGGSSTGSSSEEAAETAWGKEANALIVNFRQTGARAATKEAEAAASPQKAEEVLYRGLGQKFTRLASEIEATHAPDACVESRQTTADMARKIGGYFTELGQQGELTDAEYRALKTKDGQRMAGLLAHFEELELDHC